MKPVLIVENNTNPLVESVVEVSNGKKKYILGGPFTDFDVKNRNDRVYTANKFIPCLEELNSRILNLGAVYGEFDHPDVFDTSLSRTSHRILETSYDRENNRVVGKIQLLNTHWGKEAKALVEDECPIFVSSRAAGITEADGSVSLKKLFTYDIVADPGFATARMNSINESFGFKNDTNFRIYEMSEETNFNKYLTMENKNNEYVTKQQLADYSSYLVKELASTKDQVKKAAKSGKMDVEKFRELLEYYEKLNNENDKIVQYLDYLAEQVQIMVNENKSLKDTTERLIRHNDYLAENLEKSINYSNYLAENLDKNIGYSEYIAENLDKNIAYSEYIAENLDKNIAYSEYIAENLDKNIGYSEYIAENLDKNIAYSEYLAEHVEGNIRYSEYIAEHLDDNIAYSEYLAESLDKTVSYAGIISEKLNSGKVFEGKGLDIPTLEQAGFVLGDEEKQENVVEEFKSTNEEAEYHTTEENKEMEEVKANEGGEVCEPCEDENTDKEETFEGNSESELSKSIDILIAEAKKRKVSETNDLHFLRFLNKSQVAAYEDLTNEEKENVKLHISENEYFSAKDVLRLMNEALSANAETLEEKVIRLMPENIKPIWSNLNESAKKSIVSQARLYAENLKSEEAIDNFWATRDLKKNESTAKKLVSHEPLLQEDRLNESYAEQFMNRFKSLK